MFYNQDKDKNEYYVVNPAGLTIINLAQGDSIEICDFYGNQCLEFTIYDQLGNLQLDAIDCNLPIKHLAALENKFLQKEPEVLIKLKKLTTTIEKFEGYVIFDFASNAGETVHFTSLEDHLLLVLMNPYRKMKILDNSPSTEVFVKIKRQSSTPQSHLQLPEPLGEVVEEIMIPAKTAKIYPVAEGNYIQIIDLMGRQCSDFLAFSNRSLDKGLEDGIDITTTRSNVRSAYPVPGLFAKYYNNDNVPLVEVICDTIGRHDTFGLACNPKYYEDVGYPGHISCTENFNKELQSVAIKRRAGWPSVNLFYNTNIDCHNQIVVGESWSRAGDFVLFKAHQDLLCGTSACPDDLSPANAWDPTDIFVRIYKDNKKIFPSRGYRIKTDRPLKLTQKSGFYEKTAELTGNFCEYNGFWMPLCYHNHGAISEYWACREKVAVIDLTPLRKFEITGKDAEQLAQGSFTRNIKKLKDNQIVYTALCYPNGGMLDEGTLFKINNQHFRWIGGSDYSGEFLIEQATTRNLIALVKPSTTEFHNIAVQGPRSRELITSIIDTFAEQTPIIDLKWFHFTVGALQTNKNIELMVSRTGFTGELGYEIFTHPEHASSIWDLVMQKGVEFGITPMGFDALDMLRIEAGLIVAGNEYCDQRDPFEAGIGFTVPLKSKEDDFLGKEPLKRRKENMQKKLVGLKIESRYPVSSGDPIFVGRCCIGSITSSNFSPWLNQYIGYGLLDIHHCELGSQIEIGKLDTHQKRIKATIVPFPFYDPEKTRVRA